MLSSSIPQKFGIPFGANADTSYITYPLPEGSQASAGRASLTDGFPPKTFEPIASGGNPPWGADMNGLMKQVTAWIQWATAGGVPVNYDPTFSTKIGGYPRGAFLQSDTIGHFWISTAENNTADPDAAGANWIKFPDVLIQQQAGNYKVDVGTVNAFSVTLDPLPASLASIVGSPIRVKAANANTNTNPTIHIITALGEAAVPMINANGSPLLVGQIARAGQIFEGFLDGTGYFQLAWPQPVPGQASQPQWATGQIIIWPTETAPLGTLECDGRTLTISSYPALFNVIGTRYGGDGVSNFKIPDLRGEFLRGWDHGAGRDPGASSRTNAGGGLTGDHVGTRQTYSVDLSAIGEQLVQLKDPLAWIERAPNTVWNSWFPYVSYYRLSSMAVFIGDVQQIAWYDASDIPMGFVQSYNAAYASYPYPAAPPTPGTFHNAQNPGYFDYDLHTYMRANFSFINTVPGAETRPINVNVMYCIAY